MAVGSEDPTGPVFVTVKTENRAKPRILKQGSVAGRANRNLGWYGCQFILSLMGYISDPLSATAEYQSSIRLMNLSLELCPPISKNGKKIH